MTSHFQCAELLLHNRRFDLAEKELSAALAGDPDHPQSHAFLAVCLAHRKEFREAADHIRSAFHSGAGVSTVHHCAAVVAFLEKRSPEAIEAVAAALAIEPTSVESWVLQAQIFVAMRQGKAALDSSAKALELEPSNTQARIMRAAAYLIIGDTQGSSRELAEVLTITPENAAARAMRGWLHMDGTKRSQALEDFRESLRMDPLSANTRKGLSFALMESTLPYRLLFKPYLYFSLFFSQPICFLVAATAALGSLTNHLGPRDPALLSDPAILLVFLAILASGVVMAPVLGIAVLRFVPQTRYAVLDLQRTQNNWIFGLLTTALAFTVCAWIWGGQLCADLAALSGLSIFPVDAVFRAKDRSQRHFMAGYSVVFVCSGLAFAIWATIQRNSAEPLDSEMHSVALMISILLPSAALFSPRLSEVVSQSSSRAQHDRRQSPTDH